jgi:mannose-6-phosphate isomerase-like protein (cupin superfamily)
MADGDKGADIGEFMTGWEGLSRPGLQAWGNRRRDQLIGTVKSTRYQPKFRPLDFLEAPNIPVVFLENDDHQIGIEAVVGTQDCFHRYIDTDMIYFQYCGNTRLETEFGIYDMAPGELLMVPAGIACRSTGSNDSLRYWVRCYDPITEVRAEDRYTSETHFEMTRTGGLDWAEAEGGTPPTGTVIERMHCWHDTPEDETIAERDYDYLVGAASMKPDTQESGIRKVRPFDYFEGISGKGGGDPFAIMSSSRLKVRTYNITGEQFAFHRALRSEEVRIQFRGDAIEICEYETDSIRLGEVTIIPRGIAHSVIADPFEDQSFLRLNFYSALPWRVPRDLRRHHSDSHFQVTTNLIRDADWRKAAAAE